MAVVERIKAYASVSQIPGQADSLEVGVICPFFHGVICKGVKDVCRDFFTLRKIYDLDIRIIS